MFDTAAAFQADVLATLQGNYGLPGTDGNGNVNWTPPALPSDPGSGGDDPSSCSFDSDGDITPCEAYSRACYGVANAILGGLFDRRCGIPYICSGTLRKWAEGDSFRCGEMGWRCAEVPLCAAAACEAAGFDPFIGKCGIHPPHHGAGRHVECIIRGFGGKNLKIIAPARDRFIYWCYK
jgi:hypothetical protein